MNQSSQKSLKWISFENPHQSIIGIAFIVVGCVAILYFDGRFLLRVAMRLISGIAICGALFLGYLASREKDKNQRVGMSIVGGLCFIVGVLVWCLVPSSDSRGDATVAYWMKLQKIAHEIDGATSDPQTSITLENAEDRLQQSRHLFEEKADGIEQLSTTTVDPDAVNFAADIDQSLREFCLIMGDMLTVIRQAGTVNSRATSIPNYVLSFLRGMFGDPLGPYNDYKAEANQIGGQWEQIQARLSAWQQSATAMDAREMKLRSMLSDRYSREFPSLSSPKKQPKR